MKKKISNLIFPILKKIKNYILEIINALKKTEMNILPGNIAFFFVLALVPAFTIIVYFASFFNLSIDLIIELVNDYIPNQLGSALISILSGKGFDTSLGLWMVFSLIISSNGTYAIVSASNILYGVSNSNILKDRIKSFVLLILLLLTILFLIIFPILGSHILELIKQTKLLSLVIDNIIVIFNIIKWPLTLLILYFNIKLMYTISPNKTIKSSETTIGALTTTILWSVGTAVFSYYLTYFSTYDLLYGPLSSIIIVMIWIYFLSFVFVLGIVINTIKYKTNEKDNNN